MGPTGKRLLIRVGLVGGPLLALLVLVKLVGPALNAWYTGKVAGDGYESYTIGGEPLDVQVFVHEARGEEAAEDAAYRLQTFLARLEGVLAASLPLRKPEPGRPVRLIVLETREDLERMVAVKQSRAFENNGGYYDPDEHTIAIVRTRDGKLPDDALRHEATHLLMSRSADAGLRPWLSEGLAQYYERDGADGAPGAPDPRVLVLARASIETAGGASVEDIVGLERARFSEAGNSSAYALSAALVAFGLDPRSPPRRARFLGFVKSELLEGPQGASALLHELGMEQEELEHELERWLAVQVGG